MATRIISTRLVLEGEAEYKAQLKNVNNELALQKSELEKVRSQYSGTGKSLESLTAQLKATQGIYDSQQKKLELIRSRLEQAKSAEASYAAQVSSSRAALEASRAQLEALQASTEDTTQAEQALVEQIKAQEKALTDAETVQQKAANAVTAYETELNKVQKSLNEVSQALIKTKKELATLGFDQVAATTEQASARLNKAGNALTVGVTGPLLAAGAAAVNYASDTEESINKVEVAFSYAAEGVKKWSDTTLTSYGLAKGTALDMAALFGDMATSLGYSHAEAADLSMELVGLAADLASFKNISIDVAQTALKSIFTGETESLKNLGVVMTEANLQAYALAEGISKSYTEMDQAEKVALRYQYVTAMTANAQGDFARTSDATANQLRIAQEALKELAATAGEELLPIITPILANINNCLQALSGMDEETRELVTQTLIFTAALGPMLKLAGGATSAKSGAARAGSALNAILIQKQVVDAGATASQTALNTAMAANPAGMLVTGIGALIAVLGSFAITAALTGEHVSTLSDELEDSRKAYEETVSALEAENADLLSMVGALETLASTENKTAAQKQALLELVEQLNGAIPELNLAYNELDGTLNLSIEDIRAMAQAMAEQAEQAAAIERLSALYQEQIQITSRIAEVQNLLAEAETNYAQSTHAATADRKAMRVEMNDYRAELEELGAELERNTADIAAMEEAYDTAASTVEDSSDALEDNADSAAAAAASLDELAEQSDSLTEGTEQLAGTVDTLTKALEEQSEAGILSLNTALDLIDAGYAAALAIDQETGAITLNREAYIQIAQAKLSDQIASLETQRMSVDNALAMQDEALMALDLAESYLTAADARADLEQQSASYTAQIAALTQLRGSLQSYTFTVSSASRSSSRAKTQTELELEEYKSLKAELDHELAMDLIDQAAYYDRLRQLRDQYLTDDDNLDEYRKITEKLYDYDQELAQAEADLWSEQTETLLSELEQRLSTVSDAYNTQMAEIQSAMEDLEKEQAAMAERLAGYGDLFTVTDDQLTLGNLQEQIDTIRTYGEVLDELKGRGLSSGLLTEITGQDVDDAIAYGQQLLAMSDEQWAEYNALWEEKQAESRRIAEEFYESELSALQTEYDAKLAAALDEINSTLYESGAEWGSLLIDGLGSKEAELLAKAREMAAAAETALKTEWGGATVDGSHAAGLAYVPYDGYVAELHKGERVLTAAQAREYVGRSVPASLEPASAGGAAAAMSYLANALTGIGEALRETASPGGDLTIIVQDRDAKEWYRMHLRDFRQVEAEMPVIVNDF